MDINGSVETSSLQNTVTVGSGLFHRQLAKTKLKRTKLCLNAVQSEPCVKIKQPAATYVRNVTPTPTMPCCRTKPSKVGSAGLWKSPSSFTVLSVCVSVFLLFGGLSRGQGGGYRAARLGHIKELLFISAGCYQALMLVTPHHQVKKVIQELLRNVVGGSMFTPREKNRKEIIK